MAAQRTSASAAIFTEAINTLNSRIEKSESDFVTHLQKVEDRLDQIVDLTKTVAVLQQNSSSQGDHITEIRTQFRENSQKLDTSISRIHSRLDEIVSNQRDKLELYAKEIDIKIKNVEDKNQNSVDSVKNKTETEIALIKQELKSELKPLSAKAELTESELKKWLNRGWGVWILAVIIFGTIQTVAFKWFNSLEDERTKLVSSVNMINSINEKQTMVLESTKKEVGELSTGLKRVEQMVIDNERQLEYVRNSVKERK